LLLNYTHQPPPKKGEQQKKIPPTQKNRLVPASKCYDHLLWSKEPEGPWPIAQPQAVAVFKAEPPFSEDPWDPWDWYIYLQ